VITKEVIINPIVQPRTGIVRQPFITSFCRNLIFYNLLNNNMLGVHRFWWQQGILMTYLETKSHQHPQIGVDTRVCEFRRPRNFLSVSVFRSWKSADRSVYAGLSRFFLILIIIFLFTMENFIKKMHTGHYVFLIILVFIDVECSIFISRLNIIDAN